MQQTSQLRVLKFGRCADLTHAVHEIYREWRAGRRVLAVAASGPAGDDLLKRAEQLGLPPQSGATPASLLALALDRSGLPVTLLDPSQLPVLSRRLEAGHDVVVVPGGDDLETYAAIHASRPPLRVTLLGCGSVGGGVLSHLLACPESFQVTGVLVRDLGRDRGPGVPRHLLTTDAGDLMAREADVVVELLGGREPARRLIRQALGLGRSVVTANKALLAAEIGSLSALASYQGVSLLYSASVGGALPALEAVRKAAASGRVRRISGVLNGTCNFVLDRCLAGRSFAAAVAEAQAAGYCEADPALDLDGSDAAQKLALLAREAFGASLRWDRIPRQGIEGRDGKTRADTVVRLIAACERTREGLAASVRPVELPPDHSFARAAGAGNALRIEMENGSVIDLAAQGAGRWPTSEAVMADLLDLLEERPSITLPREFRLAEVTA
ncbi:MAG TPA: homoserine dehydrogenase [Thermoanaerobaculia bacterium]|nr:homoserine dehydrogenase [Thermoanaerobaculia bacterium]